MITLEEALARADAMTGCTETQELVKVLAAEVRRLEKILGRQHGKPLKILGIEKGAFIIDSADLFTKEQQP